VMSGGNRGERETSLRSGRAVLGALARRGLNVLAFDLSERALSELPGLGVDRDAVRIETSAGPLRARAVVGADGVGSFVRRTLGAPRGRWTAQVVEVDTPALPGEPSDVLHFDLADRALHGYAWDFPTLVAGTPLVCRGAYALQPESTKGYPDVGALLRARLDRLGIGAGARIKRFAERGLSLAEPLAQPRVLLVGEAAGIDPALGEGIAQAIAYGAVAGPYLAGAIDRDDLGFADWPAVLRGSRVGLDLRLRAAFTPWLYDRARPLVEAWAGGSRDLAIAGMRYWAGDRVPRRRLLGAALSGARVAISRRWGPWW